MSTHGIDLSVFLRMVGDLGRPMRDAEAKVKASTDRMNRNLSLSLKLGGAGVVATGLRMATNSMVRNLTQSYREIQRASGDLKSLGMENVQAVILEGQRLQSTYVGISAEAFTRAAYDIKSGISSLTDEGVAAMTSSALTVAKATKGVPEEMTSLFATSYGIFKKQFSEMSDADWGDMFGAALSASVQRFKTDGAKMQQAIESAGAGATNLGMSMTEQMTLLGMMQQQMQAGEAGTALRAFATNAARAHEAFGDLSRDSDNPVRVRVLDENGRLRAMPDILTDLKARYGETLDAFEAAEIKKAFGTDEAMKMINALYGQEAAVLANATALEEAAEKGAEFTEEMARNVDSYDGASWEVFLQQLDVMKQKIGAGLLPAMDKLAPVLSNIVTGFSNFAAEHPGLIAGIGALIVGVGGLATVAAPLLLSAAALTSTIGGLSATFGMLRTVMAGVSLAMSANPIGIAVLAIAGAAYLIYQYWEPIKEFFVGLWADVTATFDSAVSWLTSSWSGMGDIFTWENVLTVLDWATWLMPIRWLEFIPGFEWSSMVDLFSWDTVFTVLDWASWLLPIRWLEFIPGFEWSSVIEGALNWADWLNPFSWGEWVAEKLSLGDWVEGFEWIDIIAALDIRNWLSFSWGDVLPDWDWGAIIPDLPDLKGMFTDANETIDVRLENRASNVMGREWQDGLDLVNQYREGLIGLEEVKARLETSAASDGMVFDSFEVNRAQDMLELLQEIETAQANANTAPPIQSPETLMEAARVAGELAQQYPALSAAAQETQTAVTGSISQMATELQATDFTSEGQRLMQSLAAGIRSQVGTVRAAAQEITNAIRNTLPRSATMNVAVAGAPALAPVQARARGGSYGPGWLLTGEEGPELRYESEGGFVAHFGLLKQMMSMAGRTRSLMQGINPFSNGGAAISQDGWATPDFAVSAAHMDQGKSVSVQSSPTYHITVSDAEGQMETRLRAVLDEHEREKRLEMERYLND